MKKILLTTTMLVCFVAVSQAQQGRVGINTPTPAATLDIAATPADIARPDALLVPRMTRGQLEAKNAAYNNTGVAAQNQNGALVFVSSIADGTGTGKTINVTATGFYYYDAPNAVWTGVGGASAVPTYESLRGGVVFTQGPNYTVGATDNVVIANAPAGSTVNFTLPNLTSIPADVGRTVKIINNNLGVESLSFDLTNIKANAGVNPLRGIEFIWTGTYWACPQK